MHKIEAMETVCHDIVRIMDEYHRQEAEGSVNTPGGLEHMGDVWRQLEEWFQILKKSV